MPRLSSLDRLERRIAIELRRGLPVRIEDATRTRKQAVRRGRPDLVKLVDLYSPGGIKPSAWMRQSSGYATRVVSFAPGEDASFNRQHPEVVLGRFQGAGANLGSLDVLSLGKGGEIVLELGRAAKRLLVVAGNSFKSAGEVANPEPVGVWVSQDGNHWRYLGVAGTEPVYTNDINRIDPRLRAAGGDRFRLAELGVDFPVRFVKLVDGGKNFDLDGVYGN
jgi:hypothetical protein